MKNIQTKSNEEEIVHNFLHAKREILSLFGIKDVDNYNIPILDRTNMYWLIDGDDTHGTVYFSYDIITSYMVEKFLCFAQRTKNTTNGKWIFPGDKYTLVCSGVYGEEDLSIFSNDRKQLNLH